MSGRLEAQKKAKEERSVQARQWLEEGTAEYVEEEEEEEEEVVEVAAG